MTKSVEGQNWLSIKVMEKTNGKRNVIYRKYYPTVIQVAISEGYRIAKQVFVSTERIEIVESPPWF